MLHLLALDQSQCPADVRPCAGLLDFNLTLVVQLAIFVITAVALWFVLWKPLVAIIVARQEKIDEGQRAAAEAERRLDEAQSRVRAVLDGARQQAREVIEAAAREARAQADAAREVARTEAERLLVSARAEVARSRDAASLDLRVQTEALIQAAAARVAGPAVDATTLERAVREALPR